MDRLGDKALDGFDLTPLTEFQQMDVADGTSEAAILATKASDPAADADRDGRVTLKEFVNFTYTPDQVRQLARAFGNLPEQVREMLG